MKNEHYSISQILNDLYMPFYQTVSNNVYYGTLPSTLGSKENDLVLIDCGSAITDLNAYGKGVINVFLYAQPLSSGRMNLGKLSTMEAAFDKVLETLDNEHYTFAELYRDTDYNSTYNMHYIIIALNIIIK